MARAAIRFDSVGMRYGDGTIALGSITLEIPHGQFCVLLGPSGAGKSTLLRIVNGLAIPTAGTVSLNGAALGRRGLREVRRRIGMIHQGFSLVPRSNVATNVMAGALPEMSALRTLLNLPPRHLKARACALLEAVGLEPTQLARRADSLSGGQQQRVGVARAFMLDPAIILADEPVASLDPRTGVDIMALLRAQARARGTTVLCSLHQIDLARAFADRIIGLREGQVTFDGRPEDLTAPVLARIYGGTAPVARVLPQPSVAA